MTESLLSASNNQSAFWLMRHMHAEAELAYTALVAILDTLFTSRDFHDK
jgi:hypothetical protein